MTVARQKRQSAADVARALEADPFKYLCHRFNKEADGKDKDKLAIELLPYCYAKLKAIEHTTGEGQSFTVTIGHNSVPPTVGEDDA